MTVSLLNPKVCSVNFKQLTQVELNKLLKKLKNKKLGFTMAAVDVTEVEYDDYVRRVNRYKERSVLPPGSYFDVHVEYVVDR